MRRMAFRTISALIAVAIVAIIAWNLRFFEPSGSEASLISIPNTVGQAANEAVAIGDSAIPSMPTLTGPPSLQARISSERRDPSWSPQAEHALDAYFNGQDKTGSDKAQVYCAGTACIVTGDISASDQPTELRSSMQAVQNKASNAVRSWMGFSPGATVSFSPSSDQEGRIRFTTYILRSEHK